MKKILFLFILCCGYLCRGAIHTNIQYTVNELISNSFVIVGNPNEKLGYALACNSTLSDNNMPKLAMTGDTGIGMYVYKGTNIIIPNVIYLTPSNSYYYDNGGATEVDFVSNYSNSNSYVLTQGPLTTNATSSVNQIIALNTSFSCQNVTNYNMIDGTNGFRIIGTQDNQYPVNPQGCYDMNGNGYNEIIFYSFSSNWQYTLNISYGMTNSKYISKIENEFNGTNGFKIVGLPRSATFSSGDFNGDGHGDIVVNTTAGLSLVYGRQRFVKILSATNLPPEDGVVIKNAYIRKTGGFGDINGDGIDDIILKGGVVMFGRTNWGSNPDLANMGLGEIMHPTSTVAKVYFGGYYQIGRPSVIGDLNGDGYDDWAIFAIQEIQIHPPIETIKFLIVYGKPIYRVNMESWLLNSTNGFAILHPEIYSHTRGGDWDSDGYEEAIFGKPHPGLVTISPGGPSPAWSPYIFTPELIMEGRSNMFASTILTNMVTGRKGKRHMVLSDGPEPIEQEWLGTWFTTRVIRTTIDDTRTVNYWTTNILGRSKPATTLVINAVPEPGMIMVGMMIVLGFMTVRINRS